MHPARALPPFSLRAADGAFDVRVALLLLELVEELLARHLEFVFVLVQLESIIGSRDPETHQRAPGKQPAHTGVENDKADRDSALRRVKLEGVPGGKPGGEADQENLERRLAEFEQHGS